MTLKSYKKGRFLLLLWVHYRNSCGPIPKEAFFWNTASCVTIGKDMVTKYVLIPQVSSRKWHTFHWPEQVSWPSPTQPAEQSIILFQGLDWQWIFTNHNPVDSFVPTLLIWQLSAQSLLLNVPISVLTNLSNVLQQGLSVIHTQAFIYIILQHFKIIFFVV